MKLTPFPASSKTSFGLPITIIHGDNKIIFGVKPWDPAVFIAAPIILSAVAPLAVWLPATRASKLDPMQALRME